MQLENVEDIYPLSPAQQGMLFHDLLAPGTGVYCVQLAFTIRGPLDADAFRRSWQATSDQHGALRTVFLHEGLDQPLQVVRRRVDLPWTQYDWRELPPCERDARLDRFLQEDRLRGFDLAQAPLMRVALLRLAEDAWRCVWTHHHLILDGWSAGLVLRDLLACYAGIATGRERPRPSARLYREYIAWLQRQDLGRADAFWRETMAGVAATSSLGVARGVGLESGGGHFHGEQEYRFDESTTAQLLAFARRHQLTLNTLVAGAMAICLGSYGGQAEVIFGVTVSGRPGDLPGVDSMVGMFINTLPLRTALPDDRRLVEWLRDLQVRQATITPYAFMPLVRIQQQTAVPAGQPLFESILVFENYPVDESLAQAPAGLTIEDVRGMEQTNYPLAVYALPGRQLALRVGYDRRRIDGIAASRMLGHMRTVLEGMLVGPQAQLGDLSVLSTAERHEILDDFNDTAVDVTSHLLVHELFESQVRRSPDVIAAVCGSQSCSYSELNRRANALACRLRSLGAGAEVLVGICLHRSLDMVVALLGVLKAGAAYVPLDPAFPRQRLAMMLEDAAPRVIVTQRDLAASLPESAGDVLCIDADVSAAMPADDRNAAPLACPTCAAYVIFTSGSTGRPKGVVIEHRAVVNFLASMARRPGLSAGDVLVAVTTLSFDIAGLELLLPLTVGARVVIADAGQVADPSQLRELLGASGATAMQATPATWRMSLESGWVGRQGMRVFCGGEALDRDLADRLLACGSEVWNLYGPTETTIWSSVQQVAAGQEPISIGRPIANTRMYVLDRRGQPAPVGVTGELYIGGAGVARGYLRRPDLTAERFVPDPFAPVSGQRMYRTGDLTRWRSDGAIECLGRIDHQVKVRGFRIELGDIEATLVHCPGVRQAVVTDRQDAPGDRRLVAYWLSADGVAPAEEDLRRQLRQSLPEYMVPSAFVRLDALPLTPNGKIDRRALPAPNADRAGVARKYVAPRDRQEQTLAEIWSTLLGRSPIGVTDNFFELGGHSLLATRLVSRIREALGVDLPIREVFDVPTLEGLAQRIREAAPADSASIAIAAEQEEGRI